MSAPNGQARRLFLAEVISTERSYIADIQGFYDVLVKPLAQKWNPSVVSEASPVFQSLESATSTILTVAKALLREMQEAEANGEFAATIGTIFATWSPMLKSYSDFITMHSSVAEEYRTLQTSKKFRNLVSSLLAKKEQQEKLRNLTFEDLLIMPIQRVPRYEMLLHNILKESSPSEPGYDALKIGLSAIKKTANHLNQSISRKEAQDQVAAIQKQLVISAPPATAGSGMGFSRLLGGSVGAHVPSPELDILSATRSLVAEGDFFLNIASMSTDLNPTLMKAGGLQPKLDALQRHVNELATSNAVLVESVTFRVFLFNDLLLFTLPRVDPASTKMSGTHKMQYELFARVSISPTVTVQFQEVASLAGTSPYLCILVPGVPATEFVPALRLQVPSTVNMDLWTRELQKLAGVAASRVFNSSGSVNTASASAANGATGTADSLLSAPTGFKAVDSAVFADAAMLEAEVRSLDQLVRLPASGDPAGLQKSMQKSMSLSSMPIESDTASRGRSAGRASTVARNLTSSSPDPRDSRAGHAAVIIRKGLMEKRGAGLLGSWSQRYFVLRIAEVDENAVSVPMPDIHPRMSILAHSAVLASSLSSEDDFDEVKSPDGKSGAGPNGILPETEMGSALRGMLEYYKDPNVFTACGVPTGAIPLSKIVSVVWLGASEKGVESKSFSGFGFGSSSSEKLRRIDLKTAKGRSIELRVATEAEAKQWVTSIACVLELRDRIQYSRESRRVSAASSRAQSFDSAAEDTTFVAPLALQSLQESANEITEEESMPAPEDSPAADAKPEYEAVSGDAEEISAFSQAESAVAERKRWTVVSAEPKKSTEAAHGEVVTTSVSASELIKKMKQLESSKKILVESPAEPPKSPENEFPSVHATRSASHASPAAVSTSPAALSPASVTSLHASVRSRNSDTRTPTFPNSMLPTDNDAPNKMPVKVHSHLLANLASDVTFACVAPSPEDESLSLDALRAAIADSSESAIAEATRVCELVVIGYARAALPVLAIQYIVNFQDIVQRAVRTCVLPTPLMFALVVIAHAGNGQAVQGLEFAKCFLRSVTGIKDISEDEKHKYQRYVKLACLLLLAEVGAFFMVRSSVLQCMFADPNFKAYQRSLMYVMAKSLAVGGHISKLEDILVHAQPFASVTTAVITILLRAYLDLGYLARVKLVATALIARLLQHWDTHVKGWRTTPAGQAVLKEHAGLAKLLSETASTAAQSPRKRVARRSSFMVKPSTTTERVRHNAPAQPAFTNASSLSASCTLLVEMLSAPTNGAPDTTRANTATFIALAEAFANVGDVASVRNTLSMLHAAVQVCGDIPDSTSIEYTQSNQDDAIDVLLYQQALVNEHKLAYSLYTHRLLARAYTVMDQPALACSVLSDMARTSGCVDDGVLCEILPALAQNGSLVSWLPVYDDVILHYGVQNKASDTPSNILRPALMNNLVVRLLVEHEHIAEADALVRKLVDASAQTQHHLRSLCSPGAPIRSEQFAEVAFSFSTMCAGYPVAADIGKAFLETCLAARCNSEASIIGLQHFLQLAQQIPVLPSPVMFAALLTSAILKRNAPLQLEYVDFLTKSERAQYNQCIPLIASVFAPESLRLPFESSLVASLSVHRGAVGCAFIRACTMVPQLPTAQAALTLVQAGGLDADDADKLLNVSWMTPVSAAVQPLVDHVLSIDPHLWASKMDLNSAFKAVITALASAGMTGAADELCRSMEGAQVYASESMGPSAMGALLGDASISVEDTYKSLMVTYGLQGRVESAKTAFESLQRIRQRRATQALAEGNETDLSPRQGAQAVRLSTAVISTLFDDADLIPLEGIEFDCIEEGGAEFDTVAVLGASDAAGIEQRHAGRHTGSGAAQSVATRSSGAKLRQGVGDRFGASAASASLLEMRMSQGSASLLASSPPATGLEDGVIVPALEQQGELHIQTTSRQSIAAPLLTGIQRGGSTAVTSMREVAFPLEEVESVEDPAASGYNALILFYGEQGQLDLSVAVLGEMQRDEIKPDSQTLIALMLAHSACGLGHRALDVCGTAAQIMINLGSSLSAVQDVLYSSSVTACLLYALGAEGRSDLLMKAWRRYLQYRTGAVGVFPPSSTTFQNLCNTYLTALASSLLFGCSSAAKLADGKVSHSKEAVFMEIIEMIAQQMFCTPTPDDCVDYPMINAETLAAVVVAYTAMDQRATARKLLASSLKLMCETDSVDASVCVTDVTSLESLNWALGAAVMTSDLKDWMYHIGVRALVAATNTSTGSQPKLMSTNIPRAALLNSFSTEGGETSSQATSSSSCLGHAWFAGLTIRNDLPAIVAAQRMYQLSSQRQALTQDEIRRIAESDNLGNIPAVLLQLVMVLPEESAESLRHSAFMSASITESQLPALSHIMFNVRAAHLCGTDRLQDALTEFLPCEPVAEGVLLRARYRPWPETLTLLLWAISQDIEQSSSRSHLALTVAACTRNDIVGSMQFDRQHVSLSSPDALSSLVKAVLCAARAWGLCPRDVDLGVIAEIHGATGHVSLGLADFNAKPSSFLVSHLLRGMARAAKPSLPDCELVARRVHESSIPADAAMYDAAALLSSKLRRDITRLFGAVIKHDTVPTNSFFLDAAAASEGPGGMTRLSAETVSYVFGRWALLRKSECVSSIAKLPLPSGAVASLLAVVRQSVLSQKEAARDAELAVVRQQQYGEALAAIQVVLNDGAINHDALHAGSPSAGPTQQAPSLPEEVTGRDDASTPPSATALGHDRTVSVSSSQGFEVYTREPAHHPISGSWRHNKPHFSSMPSSQPTGSPGSKAFIAHPESLEFLEYRRGNQVSSVGETLPDPTPMAVGPVVSLNITSPSLLFGKVDETLQAISSVPPTLELSHFSTSNFAWAPATVLLEEAVNQIHAETSKAELDLVTLICAVYETESQLKDATHRLQSSVLVSGLLEVQPHSKLSAAKYRQQVEATFESLKREEEALRQQLHTSVNIRLHNEFVRAIQTMGKSEVALSQHLDSSTAVGNAAHDSTAVSVKAIQHSIGLGEHAHGLRAKIQRHAGDLSSLLLSQVAQRIRKVRVYQSTALDTIIEQEVCKNKWLESLASDRQQENARLRALLAHFQDTFEQLEEQTMWETRGDEVLASRVNALAAEVKKLRAEAEVVSVDGANQLQLLRHQITEVATYSAIHSQRSFSEARTAAVNERRQQAEQEGQFRLHETKSVIAALCTSEHMKLQSELETSMKKQALDEVKSRYDFDGALSHEVARASARSAHKRRLMEEINAEKRLADALSSQCVSARAQLQAAKDDSRCVQVFVNGSFPSNRRLNEMYAAVSPLPGEAAEDSTAAKQLWEIFDDLSIDPLDIALVMEEVLNAALPSMSRAEVAVLGIPAAGGKDTIRAPYIGPGTSLDATVEQYDGMEANINENFAMDFVTSFYNLELERLTGEVHPTTTGTKLVPNTVSAAQSPGASPSSAASPFGLASPGSFRKSTSQHAGSPSFVPRSKSNHQPVRVTTSPAIVGSPRFLSPTISSNRKLPKV
jgi:pentatricopeptide repeat protein